MCLANRFLRSSNRFVDDRLGFAPAKMQTYRHIRTHARTHAHTHTHTHKDATETLCIVSCYDAAIGQILILPTVFSSQP